jgi:hypothetical protein
MGSSAALVGGTTTKHNSVMVHRIEIIGGPAGLLIGYVILGTRVTSPAAWILMYALRSGLV